MSDLLSLCDQPTFQEFAAQLPLSLFVIDRDCSVRFSNQTSIAFPTPGHIHHSNCDYCKRGDQECPITESLGDGEKRRMRMPSHMCGGEGDLLLDIIPQMENGSVESLLVFQHSIEDDELALSATEEGAMRRVRQLDILNHLLASLQQSRDLKKILRVVLSALTFGKGLEFNRAFFFRLEDGQFYGELALGPLDADEASHLWAQTDAKGLRLEELLDPNRDMDTDQPIQRLIEAFQFPFDRLSSEVQQALSHVGCTKISLDTAAASEVKLMRSIGCLEAWLVPVYTQGYSCLSGVLIVDNAITRREPSEDHLDALVSFARHLGFAMDRTRLNDQLEERLIQLRKVIGQLDENHQRLMQAEKLATVGRVTANLAHELRTPVVSIGGFARLLEDEVPQEGMVGKGIRVIHQEAKRVEKVLNALVDYGQPMLLKVVDLDLGVLCNDLFALHFEGESLEVHWSTPQEEIPFRGDPLRLKQLIKALLQNVTDHAPQAMSVWATLAEHEGTLILHLEDDGPGAPQLDSESIFEPFNSSIPSSLGLGLSHARDLAALHSGTLNLVEPLHGSGFAIELKLPRRYHGTTTVR
jgi:signal transduction histidine kinase